MPVMPPPRHYQYRDWLSKVRGASGQWACYRLGTRDASAKASAQRRGGAVTFGPLHAAPLHAVPLPRAEMQLVAAARAWRAWCAYA